MAFRNRVFIVSISEVTPTGVPIDEINVQAAESKLVPDSYLVGEILECDGRIGGFNFQWAWVTGLLAGRAEAASVRADGEVR